MSAEFSDHFEFYTRGPYAPFVKETRSAGTTPIRLIHASQPEGDFSDPAHDDISLVEVLCAKAPITRDYGAGRLRLNQKFGDFELQAPNVATGVLAEGDHEVRLYILPFDRIREVSGDAKPGFDGDFGRLHATPFRDSFLQQLCQRLWRESEAGNPHGRLFVDGALIALAATLFRLQDEAFSSGFSVSGNPLTDQLRSRLDEYIDIHLGESFGMRNLAALADQPEATFPQSFKAAFGQTPHQYVLSRRIARAQEFLAAGEMPLAEIAYACGFASQSHMTDVFRQKLGVTPGRYRKEVRG